MAARSRSPWMPAGWRLLHQQLQRETVGVAAIPGSCHGHRFQFFKRYRSPNIVMAVASISAVGLQLWYMMTRQIISSSCNGLYALPNIAQPERRPSRVDWVEAGAVSRAVRHQNSCRCWWAMVVVAAIEALHYIKTKESLLLSVQELIDCDTKSFGCAGGYTENALEYVQKNGLSTESDYGYMSRERILGCKKNKALAASITGFKTIINPTEESLEEAVVQQPVIVRLQCSRSFDEYKGGIIDSPPAAPNSEGMFVHYVLIVGYDMDSNGVKFWRFKNTAGKGWGEGGFGRLRRHVADQRGVLGMLMYPAMYPVLDS